MAREQSQYTKMSGKERAVCSTLCMCLALSVMSAVALVYLSVIIYLPASRELESGIGEVSVMCITKEMQKINGDIDACRWTSCTEWCLSKGGGDCTHLYVSVRSNGTNLLMEGCDDISRRECKSLNMKQIPKRNCKEDHACTRLDKMFRCEDGMCWNITSVYTCFFDPEDVDPPVDCAVKRNCIELEGMYDCNDGFCSKVHHWNCERRCSGIRTRDKNTILIAGDNLLLANCKRALDSRTGDTVWTATDHPGYKMMTSCTEISRDYDSGRSGYNDMQGWDCVNGSLIKDEWLQDSTNYSLLTSTFSEYGPHSRLDRNGANMPFEQDITIFNRSRLMINTEGCVNTLSEECTTFYDDFGRDGRNHTSRARFPCYYAPDNPEYVVSRFDVDKTKMVFLLFFVVPSSLLVLSCGFLFMCSRMLKIDDTGHMVLRCCCTREDFQFSVADADTRSIASGIGVGAGGDLDEL